MGTGIIVCGLNGCVKSTLGKTLAENYSHFDIDFSLAAKEMYLKRGYREKKTCRIQTANRECFCLYGTLRVS